MKDKKAFDIYIIEFKYLIILYLFIQRIIF